VNAWFGKRLRALFHVKRRKENKMTEELQKWEYRAQTIGSSFFGTKDEHIEAMLNEWGDEGWEVTHVYTPSESGNVTIVAKRPLSSRARRFRSMPA
jgi:hypothetical protein